MPAKRKSGKGQALPAPKRANTRHNAQKADSVSEAEDEVIYVNSLPNTKEKPKTQFYLRELPDDRGQNEFPYFSTGDVFIILDSRNPKYQYRLQKEILESFSSVFRRTLKNQVNEASQQMKIDAVGEQALRYAFDYNVSPLRIKRESFTINLPLNRPRERPPSERGDHAPFIWDLTGGNIITPATVAHTEPILSSLPIHSPSDMRNVSLAITDTKINPKTVNKTDSEEPFICAQEYDVKAIPDSLNVPFGIWKDPLSMSDGDSSPVNPNKVEQQIQFDFNSRPPSPVFTNTVTETLNTSIPLPTNQCIKSDTNIEVKAEEVLIGMTDIQPKLNEEAKIETRPGIDIEIKGEEVLMTKANIQHKLKEEVDPTTDFKKTALAHIRTKQAHHSLFLIFYGEQPTISSTDIEHALQQSENIITVARSYDALRVTIPYIGNALMQHGRLVYQAIAEEPLRWLKISVALENAVIFNEAIIHVVGTLLYSADSQVLSKLDEKVIRLVQRKIDELDRKISRVNEILFSSSIDENGVRVKLDPVGKSSFDVWLVVQLWRAWFGDNLAECRIPSRHPSEPSIAAKLGIFYRTIAAGGDDYLPCDEVRTVLRQLNIIDPLAEDIHTPDSMQFETVDCDLALMKDYAKSAVKDICHNMSMIDPVAAGIQYLTCTQVGPHELPWVG